MEPNPPTNPYLENSYLYDRPPQYTPQAPVYGQNYDYNPLPGFQSYPVQYAPSSMPNYGATTVVVTQPDYIIVGTCPACRIGVLEDTYSCLGVLCAILFFPVGILCCLALKEKQCSNCEAYFE